MLDQIEDFCDKLLELPRLQRAVIGLGIFSVLILVLSMIMGWEAVKLALFLSVCVVGGMAGVIVMFGLAFFACLLLKKDPNH